VYRWVKKCKECNFFAGKKILAVLPLRPIQEDQRFTQWGLDFIGMISPTSSIGHKWVLTATDYFTRWIEVVALKESTEAIILDFREGIVT
ncbi:hypothetical protein KI387_044369, partial [Taxus chinensis]